MSVAQRYALGLEYDGTAFVGWQRQPAQRSVQEVLEAALSVIADESLGVVAAGRTDAGVHASGQVVHFDTTRTRPLRAWTLGANVHLPDDVAVRWAQPVGPDFHARFGATGRTYRYLICERTCRPALLRRHAAWTHRPLEVGAMQAAAEVLVGQHDFSAFRAAGCQAHSPVRTLRRITVRRCGDLVLFEVEANAFLQHMVRNLVGSLCRIGRGERDADWLEGVLAARDRRLAGPTAPARGLTLSGVEYPRAFALPGAQAHALPIPAAELELS